MGKLFEHITAELADWIRTQRVFFVATAPVAREGHVNCSPKGGDSFCILDPLTVAYQDLTGSGVETTPTCVKMAGSCSCSAPSTDRRRLCGSMAAATS